VKGEDVSTALPAVNKLAFERRAAPQADYSNPRMMPGELVCDAHAFICGSVVNNYPCNWRDCLSDDALTDSFQVVRFIPSRRDQRVSELRKTVFLSL
jgi:hypothetical protein